MDPALRAAATGMMAQQSRTEIISNNLANVNTPGFKRSRAHFEDLLYQTIQGQQVLDDPDANTAPAIQVGRGTRLAGVQRLHQQGPLEQTGRNLDIAIEGEGFFQIRMPTGEMAYSRDGSFQISDQGVLVTSGGQGLQPPIRVPEDASELTISTTGIVTVRRGKDIQPTEIGRIELAQLRQSVGTHLAGPEPVRAHRLVGPAGRRLAVRRWAWDDCSRAASRAATSRSCRRWSR